MSEIATFYINWQHKMLNKLEYGNNLGEIKKNLLNNFCGEIDKIMENSWNFARFMGKMNGKQ